jgi:alkylation response protein AidB-like acyl-CoA dehydrogenase
VDLTTADLVHEQTFRERLLAWLSVVEPPAGLRDYGATPTAQDEPAARAWQRQLYDAGWAGVSWPVEHGGRGATPMELAMFAEEMAKAGLPRHSNLVSLELAGPMIIAFGSPDQQARYLPAILRGDELWCQLFSEPGAGSDLGGLATRAEATSGGWTVSGQKVWTSGAHYCDLALLLARTGRPEDRSRGLTCFILPLRRPGIDVRPLRQMDGETKFNEVFLDGVFVSPGDVLGEVGDGWEVATSTLQRERLTLGSQCVSLFNTLDALRKAIADRPALVSTWAELWSRTWLLRTTWLSAVTNDAASQSRLAGPGLAGLKLLHSELNRDVARFAATVLGPAFDAGEDGDEWRRKLLASPGATIAGGTSEILRTLLAERVLGLPREPSTR